MGILLLVVAVVLVLGVEFVLIVRRALPAPYGDALEPDPYLWSLYRADADPYVRARSVTPEYTSVAADLGGLPHRDPRAQDARAAS